MVWLPDGEKKFEGIFIRFGATHERDRRTDTACRHIPRLCILHRSVKIKFQYMGKSMSVAVCAQNVCHVDVVNGYERS